MKEAEQIPTSQAFLWIFISTFLVIGTALMAFFYYLHLKERKIHDEKYKITTLLQKTNHKPPLEISFLMNILQLPLDRSINIYLFDEKLAEARLKALSIIKKAEIKKIRPNTLQIEYEMRTPLAYVGNYQNMAIDKEGIVFPFFPFFQFKPLPSLYLNEDQLHLSWGSNLTHNDQFQLACCLIDEIQKIKNLEGNLERVDVSNAFSHNLGRSEIVVILKKDSLNNKEDPQLQYIRLHPDFYIKNLNHYQLLMSKLSESKIDIVDLRISNIALLK